MTNESHAKSVVVTGVDLDAHDRIMCPVKTHFGVTLGGMHRTLALLLSKYSEDHLIKSMERACMYCKNNPEPNNVYQIVDKFTEIVNARRS